MAERIRQGRGWGQVRGLAVAKDPKYAGGQVVSFQLAVRGDAGDLASFADVPVVFHEKRSAGAGPCSAGARGEAD